MIYNGHTPDTVDAIDEETFTEICVLFHDGIVGGRGVYDALTPLTTAVFNYIRKPESPAYKSTQIFPWVVEYDEHPDQEYEKAQAGLMAFMSQAPGFKKERFNVGTNPIQG
jgi:hypothetical protein